MNNTRKRKASGRLVLDALFSAKDSMVLIDPKGELAAVTAHKTKKNRRGVLTLNPFIVLPAETLGQHAAKWFRLGVTTAISDLMKKQRKEGHERQQQRESQRTDRASEKTRSRDTGEARG